MTNEEHKRQLEILKSNLVDNLAIYHERITLLVQLTLFEIEDTRVNFKAKVIKPLNKEHASRHGMYDFMTRNEFIKFNSTYMFGDFDTIPLVDGKKIGKPYCPFILWLDPDLAVFVKENDDEITKQVRNCILFSEDWTHLKQV